jgi:hypothetical protein
MDRPLARRLLGAALVIGVLAELLLDGPALGINVLLITVVMLVAAWLVRRRGTAPDPLDAWLPVAAMTCAAAVALTGDRFLALVDSAAAFAFVGASVVAASGVAITRRSAGIIAMLGGAVVAAAVGGLPRTMRAARPTGAVSARVPAGAWTIVRGLLLGVPLAIIFAVLFASADPIFRRGLDEILGLRIDLEAALGRVLFVVASTWLAAGLLSVAALGVPTVAASSLGAAAGSWSPPRDRPLGVAEAIIVLGLVDVVSGAFVALQVAYLFGGLDTLTTIGMTYSDYARRGFFELVAAACLAGGLVVVLEIAVASRSRAYLAAALTLVALTSVVLVSAAIRLDLYQQAYGWTELRLYVAVAIASLGAGLAAGAFLLSRGAMRWLGHALLVIGLVALLALNALAPGAFVAERNIARVLDPSLVPPGGRSGLDAAYLGALGDDAVPVMVAALPGLAEPERSRVLRELRTRHAELAGESRFTAPVAWNLSRARALEALSRLPTP